jgi:uncharacterized protein (TIGR04255 family)
MVYETSSYKTFDEFKSVLFAIFDKFRELNHEFIFSRLGFRFINIYENSSAEELLEGASIDKPLKVNISSDIVAVNKMCRNASFIEYQDEDFL